MTNRYADDVVRWGTAPKPVTFSERALSFLRTEVGEPVPEQPAGLTEVQIPPSRLSEAVVAELTAIVGPGRVHQDAVDRIAHGGGFSYLDLLDRRTGHPPVPDAVAEPGSPEQIARLLALAERERIAVVPYGGGTSVVGGVRPEADGNAAVVSLALDRMADLIDVDKVNMTVTVGPGMTGPRLERLLSARGLTLGHFPQSWERASIGGYAATRSAGQASAGYGRSNEMIESLALTTPRGELHLGRAPGSAAGPDLRQLVIGSEGIFGVITEVKLRVRRLPRERRYEGVFFPSYADGVDAFRELTQTRSGADLMRLSDPEETRAALMLSLDGVKATAFEGYLRLRRVTGGCLAILGWEGSRTSIGARRNEAWRVLRRHGAVALGKAIGDSWLHGRYGGPYQRDALLDCGYLVETLETATGWRELPNLRATVSGALRESLGDGGPGPWVMSHLSHVYETGGSLYVTVIARKDPADPGGQWRRAKRAATDAIMASGATVTHHHAVGTDHAPWMEQEVGALGLDVLRAVKRELDPAGIMNPGKLIV